MKPSTNFSDALPDTTQQNPAPAPTPVDADAYRAAAVPRVSFTSPRRVETNRRNAQKSTGPRTEEGRKVSRLNASRHYLTGQVRILPHAERSAVEAWCRPVINSLAPVGESENQIAPDIAEGHWRLARTRATEDNLYAGHIAAALAQPAAVFNTLSRTEQRIQRALDRNYKILATVQKKRRALEEKALEEARLLFQYARQHGEAYDPEGEAKANGGLVFPIAYLEALNLRDYRLRMARRSALTWTPLAKVA